MKKNTVSAKSKVEYEKAGNKSFEEVLKIVKSIEKKVEKILEDVSSPLNQENNEFLL